MSPFAPPSRPPLRVLQVEDCADDAELVLLELRRAGYAPEGRRVETADALAGALAEGPWDVVLSDYALPGFDGLQALELVRRADPDVPFLLVSGAVGEEAAVEAMRAGAHDYVTKSRLARLGPAVARELAQARVRSERRWADRMLRETSEALQTVVQASPLGIVAVDLRGGVLTWNPAAEELFGWSADEALGRFLPFVAPEERPAFLAELARELAGAPLRGVEALRPRKDGTLAEVTVWTAPLRDADGRPIGVIGLFADDRGRREAEREILRHREQLQRLASELSLAQERERRRIATELHDGIGQTLAFAKMQLRALQAADPVLDERLGRLRELLDQAIRDTRSLTADISCEALYRLGLEPALQTLCEQTRARHGLTCELRVAGLMPDLPEDEKVLVFQTVRELLANAAKHSGASTVRVTLVARPDQVRVTVADDGVGFSADPAAAALGSTDGFGLFSLQERWRRLGGRIAMARRPRGGARVTAAAPRAREATD